MHRKWRACRDIVYNVDVGLLRVRGRHAGNIFIRLRLNSHSKVLPLCTPNRNWTFRRPIFKIFQVVEIVGLVS